MAYIAKATSRTETGKGRIRKLRRGGIVPAVVYGHGDPSAMLSLNEHDFGRLLDKLRGHSPIVELDIDGKSTRCVIKTLQRNPVNGRLLHVDFQKVHADEKITINVPVLLHGTAIGVKEGGMLDHLLREVPVRATISRIPEHFDVDVTELKMGESVHLSRLAAEEIEFTLPPESAVVTVLAPRKLIAETPKVEAAEGEAPAEGEAAKEPAAEEKTEEKKKK
ncbi:MAG: 50S ribosomal protein L25 [bacterium]